MQEDQVGLSTSSEQNGDIVTLAFSDNEGAIVIKATSPEDFEI